MFKFKFKKKRPVCAAVIAAAGSASRMGGTDKVLALLEGKPVLWYAIRAFDLNPCVQEIVVVVREDQVAAVAQLCEDGEFEKVRTVLVGGENRVESVRIGADAVSKEYGLIAVHDGARPLVSQHIITETVEKAARFGAAAPAIPVKDTVKRAEGGTVAETPDRSTLFAVQTPQIFDADLLRAALKDAEDSGAAVTDDCAAVERIGMRPVLTKGAEENLKITTPIDLEIAALYLRKEGSLCVSDTATTSTG